MWLISHKHLQKGQGHDVWEALLSAFAVLNKHHPCWDLPSIDDKGSRGREVSTTPHLLSDGYVALFLSTWFGFKSENGNKYLQKDFWEQRNELLRCLKSKSPTCCWPWISTLVVQRRHLGVEGGTASSSPNGMGLCRVGWTNDFILECFYFSTDKIEYSLIMDICMHKNISIYEATAEELRSVLGIRRGRK